MSSTRTKTDDKESWFKKNCYVSRWRVRVLKLGLGWRTAARSQWFPGKRFRNQAEPVRVLRAYSLWIQWG